VPASDPADAAICAGVLEEVARIFVMVSTTERQATISHHLGKLKSATNHGSAA
jgi:hypothetical protein